PRTGLRRGPPGQRRARTAGHTGGRRPRSLRRHRRSAARCSRVDLPWREGRRGAAGRRPAPDRGVPRRGCTRRPVHGIPRREPQRLGSGLRTDAGAVALVVRAAAPVAAQAWRPEAVAIPGAWGVGGVAPTYDWYAKAVGRGYTPD